LDIEETIMTTTTFEDFRVEEHDRAPGMILPQTLGSRLWVPMWLMAVLGFGVGFVLAIARADDIASGAAATTIASLRHVQAGFMFIGFAAVFAAVSFAIARILGVFRTGGGSVQEATGNRVQILPLPATGRVFILGMVMAMMTIVIAVVIHFVVGAGVASGATSLSDGAAAFDVLEGVRRMGVALYLASIAFGLATIITVIRFQSRRIRSLTRQT
jgi:hypothetical protein